jgi:outer membrane biosynthesis protein TonB
MLSELNRRTFFAAAAAFLVALAVAYALSSTGQASEAPRSLGSPAAPLDVASGVAGNSSLGDAAGLPAMARRPKPPEPDPEPERDVAEAPVDADSEPYTPPPVDEPAVETPTPQPQPQPPPAEVEVFDDSG